MNLSQLKEEARKNMWHFIAVIKGVRSDGEVNLFRDRLDTLIEKAFAAGKEEVIEFLKAEKSTYSEDVAKRERDVYDHIILCLTEEARTNKSLD